MMYSEGIPGSWRRIDSGLIVPLSMRAEGPVLPSHEDIGQQVRAKTERYFRGIDLSKTGITTLNTLMGRLTINVVVPSQADIEMGEDEKYATATLDDKLKAKLSIWKKVGAKTFGKESGRIYSLYAFGERPEVSLNFSEEPEGSEYESHVFARYGNGFMAEIADYPSQRFLSVASLVGIELY